MAEGLVYVLLYISLFFEVFVLLIFIEKKPSILGVQKKEKRPARNLPFVTVMVPVFNEEKTVTGTIDSLRALTYPKDKFEIIVINDGSTDNTVEILQPYAKRGDIHLLSKENGGKHTALNYGLQHARGDIIGCLDADSFVEPDALSQIVAHFDEPDIMAVIPGIKVHKPETILQHMQAAEYMIGIFIRKIYSLIGSVFIAPGPFSFFRRDVFSIVGPYRHAHNTEDLEICLRMQQKHMRIVNAHEAFVHTVSPRTLKKLYVQRVRWTYGFLRNIRDYYKSFFFKKEQGNLGFFILPLSTLSIYSGIYFAFSFVWSFITDIYTTISEYMVTGWYINMPSFDFTWFFIHTNGQTWIGAVMILLVFCMMAAGMLLADKRIRMSHGIVYYAILYAFLVPLWLTSAAWKALFAKKPSWR